ncbi:bifunctional 2-polyprenyl-6-hydroxyphenol methylase/3-demethylubiquinol 3-O-methyltransferase UbiG [Bacteroides sp. 519]|uniref:class I SAM-dependent methyltransferase n=1 Tax=Bacteroides sp. 519 TaxID=2302937 RepID=UPI001EF26618|nr:class I SAM-dependent methyltransferase [Bacteroides sp. 519]MDL2224246.1 methyltransferase domain-containing protein [Bacteroidales bacterium OttesenSCG-928-M06]
MENMKIKDTKPQLFERTDCNIWTDSYIQQQMLKEHLNPMSDGASRKQESISKIIDFVLSQSKLKSRLLDLGCGPGLYTSLFRDKGYEVTGVDFNKVSIEYATTERKDIHYIFSDYINEYPDGKYDTVILIYCDLGTHSDNDRDKLLKNIYQSLDEDGTFIFDIFTEALVNDKQESRSWDYAPTGGFWSQNEYLLLSQTFHYPENKAFGYQYNLLTKDETKHFLVWDRYYSEEEITLVLRNIGFRKVTIHKNILDGNDFTSNSEMFVVAKK